MLIGFQTLKAAYWLCIETIKISLNTPARSCGKLAWICKSGVKNLFWKRTPGAAINIRTRWGKIAFHGRIKITNECTNTHYFIVYFFFRYLQCFPVYALYFWTVSWTRSNAPFDTLVRSSVKLVETSTGGVSDLPRQVYLVLRARKVSYKEQ